MQHFFQRRERVRVKVNPRGNLSRLSVHVQPDSRRDTNLFTTFPQFTSSLNLESQRDKQLSNKIRETHFSQSESLHTHSNTHHHLLRPGVVSFSFSHFFFFFFFYDFTPRNWRRGPPHLYLLPLRGPGVPLLPLVVARGGARGSGFLRGRGGRGGGRWRAIWTLSSLRCECQRKIKRWICTLPLLSSLHTHTHTHTHFLPAPHIPAHCAIHPAVGDVTRPVVWEKSQNNRVKRHNLSVVSIQVFSPKVKNISCM